jgi:2-methylisocitrate lyase-like PEP mutase family enzyme
LEDQAMPKKCGHFAGKELIPAEEMQHKLRAMLEARRDPDFFVVARTDAMGVTDLDDAIRRLTSYAEVGADGLYVDAPRSVDQLKEIARRLKPLGLPLLFNMVRSGKSGARAMHLINEALPRAAVLARAVALAEQVSAYDREIVALGRGLYYGIRSTRSTEALAAARQALLAALAVADRSRR